MSHIIELGLAFADQDLLERVLSTFPVSLEHDCKLRGSWDTRGRDTLLPLIARLQNGRGLGFRRDQLKQEAQEGLADQSEWGVDAPSEALVPVGDFYYGDIEAVFGQGLSKLQAEYYAEMLRSSSEGWAEVTVRDMGDHLVVEQEIAG